MLARGMFLVAITVLASAGSEPAKAFAPLGPVALTVETSLTNSPAAGEESQQHVGTIAVSTKKSSTDKPRKKAACPTSAYTASFDIWHKNTRTYGMSVKGRHPCGKTIYCVPLGLRLRKCEWVN